MSVVEQLRKQFPEWGIDGLIVTKAENRRYITSFTGSAGVVLISQAEAIFLTDFRYERQAHEQIHGFDIFIHGQSQSMLASIVQHVQRMRITKLGFEAEAVNFDLYAQLEEQLEVDLVPTRKAVEKLRMIKTESEIEKLKKAAGIGDDAFDYIQSFIKPGVTELDVAHELEYFMRKKGATSNSSKIIVASGDRSSLPHGVASKKRIEAGDMVTLDYGALYEGYRSDMTRTLAVGEPDVELMKIYGIVREALQRGIESIKAGMLAKEVDAIVRDYINSEGYGKYFGHGAGHGIGLEIHEDPFFAKNSEIRLKPGMVVTIEPGIYIPELGGVRIEDDVLISEVGNEILTHATKELVIL